MACVTVAKRGNPPVGGGDLCSFQQATSLFFAARNLRVNCVDSEGVTLALLLQIYVATVTMRTQTCIATMRWIRLVGLIKVYVSFDDILQDKPRLLSILLTLVTPY